MLSKADHDRIHDAIAQAEQATAGEIFCVVAAESGGYREVPYAWAAGAALVAPALALLWGLRPGLLTPALLMVMQNGWVAAHTGALNTEVFAALIGYATLQALLFVAVLGWGVAGLPGMCVTMLGILLPSTPAAPLPAPQTFCS